MSRPMLRYLERGLWGVVLVCIVVTGAALHAHALTRQGTDLTLPVADDVAMYDRERLGEAVDSVIANDVFRFGRRPATVAFGATPVAASAVQAPARPHVTVIGILGGPPWRAVLNGVPNREGNVVVAPGDTLGGLQVRSIRHDIVVIRGVDTTWTLRVDP